MAIKIKSPAFNDTEPNRIEKNEQNDHLNSMAAHEVSVCERARCAAVIYRVSIRERCVYQCAMRARNFGGQTHINSYAINLIKSGVHCAQAHALLSSPFSPFYSRRRLTTFASFVTIDAIYTFQYARIEDAVMGLRAMTFARLQIE